MPETVESARVLADRLNFVVQAASRAVSVHNTQPWHFRLVENCLDLLADHTRQLRVADPRGRELMISCGAALYNARLAICMLGYVPDVSLLPVAGEPAVLARLTPGNRTNASVDDRRLFAAIPHRHTHRSGFTPLAIPRDLLVAVQTAVADEGAQLYFVERPGQRRALSELVAAADRAQRADTAALAEILAWTAAPGESRPDGVPALAYPAEGGNHRVAFPIRDFAAGRGWGSAEPSGDGLSAPIAVLTTAGDQVPDWLVAGQALQRMLLLAATRWIFAALFSSPVESPDARVLVRDELGTANFPQMIVQLGHSPFTAATPRRPVGDVVDNAAAPEDSGLA